MIIICVLIELVNFRTIKEGGNPEQRNIKMLIDCFNVQMELAYVMYFTEIDLFLLWFICISFA